jgi:preprotein translocase subunit SecD
MLNRYSLWKNAFIALIVSMGFYYAAPNLYAPDPALQIGGSSGSQGIDEGLLARASEALTVAEIEHFGQEVQASGKTGLVRLQNRDQQLKAQAVLQRALGDGFIVALNLAPTTPDWLMTGGAQPMKLGLDLSGGVHFKLEVDVDAATQRKLEQYENGIKRRLRDERIRGLVALDGTRIGMTFRAVDDREAARVAVRDLYPELLLDRVDDDAPQLFAEVTQVTIAEVVEYAVAQNLTTLRNRVNELGVSEPLVQRQGKNRIVVELPGIQDTAEAKRILGKVANLEFRLVAETSAPISERQRFDYRGESRQGMTEWLERDIIITGERVTVVIRDPYDEKKVLTAPVIQSALGAQFQITGLDNPGEASELALMLRAGALAAPISFVEERTVGPSLGAENIELGMKSLQLGLALVVLFMAIYYRVFGVLAVVALSANLVLLVAVMSLLSATLTLPGIAGIVLTVGMAVDANVLIFARIREELASGTSNQLAIHSGFERAVTTILDANITTLIVAVILYAVGTGPIKGFAVTLSVGIITSMFTAIMGTRALVNVVYGGRRVQRLSIGRVRMKADTKTEGATA